MWILGSALSISTLPAADFHVSPEGAKGAKGSKSSPFRTLAEARDAARAVAGREPVTIHVADGVYYLPDTLVLGAADSGSEKHPVIYQAENEGKAVISGGWKLDLKWTTAGNGVFKAKTPEGLAIDQLFIDGKRQRMARYPNFDAARTTAAYQGFAADAFSKERSEKWRNPVGGYIHAMHSARWGGYHYRITGKNTDGSVAYEGGWQNNRQMGMHKEFRMVENILEELDAPGEWFHDAGTGQLYFMPEPGTDPARALVEVVRLRHLVEFRGTQEKPVRHVAFKGFTFRHAARTFMDTKEPLLRSDWAIYRGGAVLLEGTEHVSILDGTFDQVGGNAIFVNNYNRKALIKGCHIRDAGASGVCFVGDPNAVRSPLFEYGQKQDLAAIDRNPGPKTSNYPADSTVEDCLIHGIGRVERQPAGVQISMSYKITVRDTTIHDCARAGINISEGTWGGHLIERCDVFDTVLETHDHGSFNSWGRDRFWTSNHRGVSEPEVKKDSRLPFLDVIEPITIRDSRWRCDHGWDVDLDDGSSNYVIYNNLMLAGGLKFREGYGRKAFNNIMVNNGFHPHVWFDQSDSEFRHNIVMKAHAPIGQPKGWGVQVDENLFASEAQRAKHLDSGGDAKSVGGDPMFIDPAAGDFRVKEGSPAFRVGFKNFPMDQFGVKKPALKAIAKTPVIPALEMPADEAVAQDKEPRLYWLGAPLHGLKGEEFSAFGVSRDDLGVQLVEVPASSAAAAVGLKTNDLIQQLNGTKTPDTSALFAALLKSGDAPLKLRVIRNQQPVELTLQAAHHTLVESGSGKESFARIALAEARGVKVTAKRPCDNEPLTILTDGALGKGYGPVFGNGTRDGAYKLDLGSLRPVHSVNAWSFDQNGNRGAQKFTLFGSRSESDPGWDTADATRFVALGSVDTSSLPPADFTASSLRAAKGGKLGDFRWIVIETLPVTALQENTAWREFHVETRP